MPKNQMPKNQMSKRTLFLLVVLTVAALLVCIQTAIDSTSRHFQVSEIIGSVVVLLSVLATWWLEYHIRRNQIGQDPDNGSA